MSGCCFEDTICRFPFHLKIWFTHICFFNFYYFEEGISTTSALWFSGLIYFSGFLEIFFWIRSRLLCGFFRNSRGFLGLFGIFSDIGIKMEWLLIFRVMWDLLGIFPELLNFFEVSFFCTFRNLLGFFGILCVLFFDIFRDFSGFSGLFRDISYSFFGIFKVFFGIRSFIFKNISGLFRNS